MTDGKIARVVASKVFGMETDSLFDVVVGDWRPMTKVRETRAKLYADEFNAALALILQKQREDAIEEAAKELERLASESKRLSDIVHANYLYESACIVRALSAPGKGESR